MCRWLAYSGKTVRLQDLLFEPEQNLIDQSMSSRSESTVTNGDGFGVGWYGKQNRPGLYKSLRPAWNDFNLHDLADNIESALFLAHVRATSLATVQETNCHPFRYENMLFVHNGEIFGIEKFRKSLLMAIDSKFYENIFGTTDSEIFFHLALTFGLQENVTNSVERTVDFIEKIAKEHGIEESVWMTLGISDGKTLWGIRYASDDKAPSLYYSPDIVEFEKLNPKVIGRFDSTARCIVSEPMGIYQNLWKEIPTSSGISICDGEIAAFDFKQRSIL